MLRSPHLSSSFGRYPTPVRALESLSRPETSLWIKHDDQTNPLYGGNKVRKIGGLLADAALRGADTIVTIGALGSQHVLTAGLFGRALGMRVEAVVVAQPATSHVLDNLRANVASGVALFPAASYAAAALLLLGRTARGAHYIPAGGSNRLGAQGFVEAATELAAQVRSGELPEPDLIVVAMGSGGTAAGLAAGLVRERLRTRVLAVTVAEPAWLVERQVRELAVRCAAPGEAPSVLKRLEQTRRYLGGGYGHSTPAGKEATRIAAQLGITLDPTYTAKAFAAALDRVALGREKTILYWHTLSSAPLLPLLIGAPSPAELDPKLLRLARTIRQ
jgi:D-cysteine desulfhydrase